MKKKPKYDFSEILKQYKAAETDGVQGRLFRRRPYSNIENENDEGFVAVEVIIDEE